MWRETERESALGRIGSSTGFRHEMFGRGDGSKASLPDTKGTGANERILAFEVHQHPVKSVAAGVSRLQKMRYLLREVRAASRRLLRLQETDSARFWTAAARCRFVGLPHFPSRSKAPEDRRSPRRWREMRNPQSLLEPGSGPNLPRGANRESRWNEFESWPSRFRRWHFRVNQRFHEPPGGAHLTESA